MIGSALRYLKLAITGCTKGHDWKLDPNVPPLPNGDIPAVVRCARPGCGALPTPNEVFR